MEVYVDIYFIIECNIRKVSFCAKRGGQYGNNKRGFVFFSILSVYRKVCY